MHLNWFYFYPFLCVANKVVMPWDDEEKNINKNHGAHGRQSETNGRKKDCEPTRHVSFRRFGLAEWKKERKVNMKGISYIANYQLVWTRNIDEQYDKLLIGLSAISYIHRVEKLSNAFRAKMSVDFSLRLFSSSIFRLMAWSSLLFFIILFRFLISFDD